MKIYCCPQGTIGTWDFQINTHHEYMGHIRFEYNFYNLKYLNFFDEMLVGKLNILITFSNNLLFWIKIVEYTSNSWI